MRLQRDGGMLTESCSSAGKISLQHMGEARGPGLLSIEGKAVKRSRGEAYLEGSSQPSKWDNILGGLSWVKCVARSGSASSSHFIFGVSPLFPQN